MAAVQREEGVDVLKGAAVCCMVFAHTVQLLPPGGDACTQFAYYFVNLTAFPAFLFCFGYACRRAYLQKPRAAAARGLARGFCKTMAALYACGLAWLLCTGGFGPKAAAKLLLALQLPGYSEFLLSFALLYVLVWGLALTWFPYSRVHLPVLGALVGMQGASVFPLAQYAAYFLLGAWFSGRTARFSAPVAMCAALGTAAFYVFYAVRGEYPARFPPTALWVAGGAAWVYAAWLVCMRTASWRAVRALRLAFAGRHSLWFLTASNIMLFVLHRAGLRPGAGGVPGALLHPAVCLGVLLAAGALCPAGRAAAEAAAALRGVRGRAHSARRPPGGGAGRHAAPLAGKPPLAKSAVFQRKRLCWGGRRARFKSCAGRKSRPAGMAAPCTQGVLAQNAAAGHKSVPVPLCWRKKACIIEKAGRCGACPRTRAHTGAGRPGRRDEKGACML